MPVKMIMFAQLPTVAVGRAAPLEPKLSIQDNGQIRFNGFACKNLIGSNTHLAVRFNGEDVGMFPCDLLLIPCTKETADIELSKGGTAIELKKSDKGGIYLSGARILAKETEDGKKGLGYDYRASGNQTFDIKEIEVGSKKTKYQAIHFESDSLTPPPVKPKKPKAAKTVGANGVPAVPVVAALPPVAAVVGDDLDLN